MAERVILSLLAFAAMAAGLCAVYGVIRLWFDEDMRPKRRQRREPWGTR